MPRKAKSATPDAQSEAVETALAARAKSSNATDATVSGVNERIRQLTVLLR